MIVSVRTGKSGKSNWLDRLRSTKGFPAIEEDLDLDRFLSNSPPPISTPESTQPPVTRRRELESTPSAVVTNVLSELFFIGGSAENAELSGKKKIPRKQTNPRLCVASSNNRRGISDSSVRADRIKESQKRKLKMKMKMNLKRKKKMKMKRSSDFTARSPATLNSDTNSLTRTDRGVRYIEEEDDEEEEEEEDEELRGYSRTEATVIDTSFADWKVERLVFRKKNVWKVMEKRGKPKSFGRKKRKWSCDSDDEPISNSRAKEYDIGDRSLKFVRRDEECE